MTFLKSIAITGFKSFGARVEVPLRPLNLLIGANGSGKSNFLDVFSFLKFFSQDRIDFYVGKSGGANKFLHFGFRNTGELKIEIKFGDNSDGYDLKFYHSTSEKLHWDKPGNDEYLALGQSHLPEMGDQRWNTIERLKSWTLYHFHDTSFDSPMKKTANLHDNRFLRSNGSNLAAFLYLLRERYETSYRLIRKTVQMVAPFFDDFVLEPMALNSETIRLEWRHKGSDDYFDISSLSDGTLRFIALTTLLLQPKELRPSVILLDEPELGLHPFAIAILAAMLHSVSTETQIVVATQSPGLLDRFEPEDILVAERVAGETRIARLEAEPLREWLEDYSLGELWEKNHFGGRPTPERKERV